MRKKQKLHKPRLFVLALCLTLLLGVFGSAALAQDSDPNNGAGSRSTAYDEDFSIYFQMPSIGEITFYFDFYNGYSVADFYGSGLFLTPMGYVHSWQDWDYVSCSPGMTFFWLKAEGNPGQWYTLDLVFPFWPAELTSFGVEGNLDSSGSVKFDFSGPGFEGIYQTNVSGYYFGASGVYDLYLESSSLCGSAASNPSNNHYEICIDLNRPGADSFWLEATGEPNGYYYNIIMDFVSGINESYGEYYLLNYDTRKAVQPDNLNHTTNKIKLEQYTWNKGNQQTWEFIYVGDGYYKIKNKKSGYYITSPTSSSASENITQESTTADTSRQRWKVTHDGTTYLLQAENREGSGLYMTVGDSLFNTNGVDIRQKTLSNAGDRAIWGIIDADSDYYMIINNYFDAGYDIRFPGAASRIDSYQMATSSILFDLFDLSVIYNVTPYTSCTDDCKVLQFGSVSLANSINSCPHSANHWNRNNVRDNLRNQFGNGTTTLTRIAWTGHLMEGNVTSASNSTYSTIVMTIANFTYGPPSYITAYASWVFDQSIGESLHEISHQLGAKDHYCYGTPSIYGGANGPSNKCSNPSRDCWWCDHNGLNGAPPDCLMTSSHIDDIATLPDKSVIYGTDCGCVNNIKAHLANHH